MSYHGQKLINSIKDNVSAINLELIRKEFQYIEDSQKIESSDDIICSLINIVGNYLVSAENRKIPEEFAIFDTFCCLDFMSEFLKLSSYDLYKIDLQLIKMLSFLLINIKNKPWLYYLCSNNLLNKIISKDYSKYDDEFLSYYVNFLKSLSLLLDETSIQLFYIEKKNSFPLIENILKFYDHKDSMIRNVVRNTVMNIFRLKNAKIEEYFSKLPSVLYFVKIVNQIKNICFEMKDQINNQNNKKMSYLFDDLYDEIIYIDDLLNLNLERVNYILINCFFHFFILPILCGSICNENKKLSKEMSLFIITFFC
jgi:protein CLEC16A